MRSVRAPEITAAALLGETPHEAAIAAYEQAGAIVVRALIGSEWLETLRAAYDAMAEAAELPYGGKASGMRQLTTRSSKPEVGSMSQTDRGSSGGASMFTKKELAKSVGALTIAWIA